MAVGRRGGEDGTLGAHLGTGRPPARGMSGTATSIHWVDWASSTDVEPILVRGIPRGKWLRSPDDAVSRSVARDLGLVAAGPHVAPATPPRAGTVDEHLVAAGVVADPQPPHRAAGDEVGQRAGNGCPGLVQPVAHPRQPVLAPIGAHLELVEVEAVAEDVVELPDGWRGSAPPSSVISVAMRRMSSRR